MRLGSPARYGWSQQGQKSYGTACGGSWKNVTMLGAIGLSGFRGFMNIESGTSVEVFRAFVEHQLVPRLREGDCVILDNLAAHKNSRTLQLILDKGATYKFLPPYSPELNPIEKMWAKLKDFVRRCVNDTREAFDDAVADAMATISEKDIEGWFSHCGYSITHG